MLSLEAEYLQNLKRKMSKKNSKEWLAYKNAR